jgi:FAD/FMN-containing dehydrogenase
MADAPSAVALQGTLASIVGENHVISDRDRLASYERDWTGRWEGRAGLAVRPASTDQVAAVMAACGAAGVDVVVQGGNTGLVGGATPMDDEIVLDTTRLDEVGEPDPASRQVTVGAGVTLEEVQTRARRDGLDFAVDLPARGQATIGGMVATNAGGALALRYGTTRSSVAGVEAVLPDGSVLSRLSGLLKDNAGYDLPSLLVGSEGTLAVLTRIRLALTRRPRRRAVALIGVDDLANASTLVATFRDGLGDALEAADFVDRQGLELVCARLHVRDPLPRPCGIYVVVQVADDEDPTARLAAVESEDWADVVAVGEDTQRCEALWAYRESVSEAVAAYDVPHKFDLSVPLSEVAPFADAARLAIEALDAEAKTVIYGHLGDGNLHVNVLGFRPADDRPARALAPLVAEHGGSISAEHGIGRQKRELLGSTRSAAEIDAMRAIKQALDPRGMLGRDRVLPAAPDPRDEQDEVRREGVSR